MGWRHSTSIHRLELLAIALVLAATAWGMFVRARRQLLFTLRDRALRAETDQRLQEERARLAERTRIAREMHDVLAHRISLIALHAGGLEMRPDLPPEKVRETAVLLRSTARQALEELRSVIGVLREEPGQESAPAAPQPTLADIPRLVEMPEMDGITATAALRRLDAPPQVIVLTTFQPDEQVMSALRKRAQLRLRAQLPHP